MIGMNKPKLLLYLWKNSKESPTYALLKKMGHYEDREPNIEDCIRAIENGSYVDYFFGRVIKVDFNRINFNLYDRDCGSGAGENAVLDMLTDPFNNDDISLCVGVNGKIVLDDIEIESIRR